MLPQWEEAEEAGPGVAEASAEVVVLVVAVAAAEAEVERREDGSKNYFQFSKLQFAIMHLVLLKSSLHEDGVLQGQKD